jgi:hypothetical protein
MFACVVFVAVAMWTESKIARRREAANAADVHQSADESAGSDDPARE